MFLRIVQIGSRYYYRIRIPKDLLKHFPLPEIKKSLKTSEIKAARILASDLDEQVQSTFALLRINALSDEQNKALAGSLLSDRGKARIQKDNHTCTEKSEPPYLSKIFDLYVADRSHHWTEKSKVVNQH